MSKKNNFVFLSESFHNRYPHFDYPEIELKDNRPHVLICVEIDGVKFAVPMRSNINHPYVFWTDKDNKCGLDFSKAVVIEKESYIDSSRIPYIRPNEFKALQGKEYEIRKGLKRYIGKYKKAKTKSFAPEKSRLLRFSTLQYFEEHLDKVPSLSTKVRPQPLSVA